jgi:NADH-quinone oxidoreductase subunit C
MTGSTHDTTLAAAFGSEPGAVTAEEMYGCPVSDSRGQMVLHPPRDRYVEIVKALADDGYAMIVDLCGVDYLEYMDRPLPGGVVAERFEVVLNLLDITHRRRIRLRVQVPESDPTLASLFDVHPGSEAYERETFDMFGVVFTDHPDMTRILMPEDWIGHPLRKDFEVGAIPVQFKGAPS